MIDLHDCYSDGHRGVLRRNDRLAVQWLRKALALDDSWARYTIAERMLEGRGVRRDPRGGIRLLRQAAIEDEGAAYALLAECSLTGRGMKRDVRQAITWFREAGKRGTDSADRIRECRKALRTRAQSQSRPKSPPIKPAR